MPILRKNSKLCHFAHIPKCGGSSIELYCMKIGAKIAFWDNHYVSHPAPQKWNISSPQHVDGYSLARLVPPDFLDFGFAVVRDPVKRLTSAFKFQLNVERTIPAGSTLSDFVREKLTDAAGTLGKHDNHFLPQSQFLIPKMSYQVFRLEDGMEQVKTFIDAQLLGAAAALPIQHVNAAAPRKDQAPEQFALDAEAVAIVAEVYAEDFKNFQYDVPEALALSA